MNQQEKTYLSKRIQGITELKIRQTPNVVDIIPFLKRLRIQNHFGFIKAIKYNEKVKGILEKCLSSETLPDDSSYHNVFQTPETLIFSNYEEITEAYNKVCEKNREKNEKRTEEIRGYSQKLQDEVMLGDAKEALKQLAAFEKKVF